MHLEPSDHLYLPRRRNSFLPWHLTISAAAITFFLTGNYVLPDAYCFFAGFAFLITSNTALVGLTIYFGNRSLGLFWCLSVLMFVLQLLLLPVINTKPAFLSIPYLLVGWFLAPIVVSIILQAIVNHTGSNPDPTFSAKAVDIKYIQDITAEGNIICRGDPGIYELGDGNWEVEAYLGQALELHTALALDGRQHPMYFMVSGVEEPINITRCFDRSNGHPFEQSSGEAYHDNWLA